MGESRSRVSKRKTHSKSRGGCFRCKQRHIKCNEAQPRCANCVRLGAYCTWPTVQRKCSNSLHPKPGDHVSSLVENRTTQVPDTNESGIGAEFSIPDLRLLQHWMSKGYSSMRPNHSAKDENYWRDCIIENAFEHPYLLHGYLAMSAVHKACSDSVTNRPGLLVQAGSHISQGLAIYRRHIESPVLEKAIPMFMMCTVLFTYNLGSAQLQRPEDPMAAILHCFRLLAGVKVVFDPFWQQLKDTKMFSHMVDLAEGDDVEALDARARNTQTPEILILKELTEHVQNAQDRDSCVEAINDLHVVSLRLQHASGRSNEYSLVLAWAAEMGEHFMSLISSYNPVACIIVCHFATLLAQGRPVWWIGSWPQWLLAASEQLLAATPELLKWLEWPRRIISQNIPSFGSTPTTT